MILENSSIEEKVNIGSYPVTHSGSINQERIVAFLPLDALTRYGQLQKGNQEKKKQK